MKKFTQILILSIFTILMIGGFTKSAFADTPTIEFQNSPLFGESNFIPGQSVTKTIKFTNNTDITRNAYIRVAEVVNTDKFGDAVTLVIKQGDTILYNDTFSNFFNKGKVNLPQVEVGNTNIISFIATFIPESNNDYQNKVMGFGLQAVLEDVEVSNDTTTVIGGSGGITLGAKHLAITNENATATGMQGTIMISWTTNIPATSQVIYGLTSGGSYNLDLTAPNFGYPFSTIETNLDPNKKTDHIVSIINLPLGLYSYRVVSRASPATVSYEHQFTVPLLAENNNPILNNNNLNTNGQVLGAQNNPLALGTNNNGGLDTTQNAENLNNNNGDNLLGASAGNIMGLSNLSFWALLVALLLLIILIIKIIDRRRKNKNIIL